MSVKEWIFSRLQHNTVFLILIVLKIFVTAVVSMKKKCFVRSDVFCGDVFVVIK